MLETLIAEIVFTHIEQKVILKNIKKYVMIMIIVT